MIHRLDGHEYFLEETFHAPIEKMWEYFTDPEKLVKWWGPKGWKAAFYDMEVIAGAQWRYCLRLMQGNYCAKESWFAANCKEVELYRRIVTTDIFTDSAGTRLPDTPTMKVTLSFKEVGGKTTVTCHTVFESEEGALLAKDWGVLSGMKEGWERLRQEVSV